MVLIEPKDTGYKAGILERIKGKESERVSHNTEGIYPPPF